MSLKIFIGVVLILVLVASAYLTSGYFKRQLASYTGYSEICVDGVKYLQFVSGASVKYSVEGKVERCN